VIADERPSLANSLWSATANPCPAFPELDDSQATADVAVIGGGFTGLSAALHLAERGVRVAVLEARTPGWGASGRNGGQVLPGLKGDPDDLQARFGTELGARMARFSGGAPDAVFSLIERHGIACDPVRTGWIQPAHSEATLATSARRAAQWQRRGAPVEVLSREAVSGLLGTQAYVGGLLDRRAGSVHPLNYSLGLADAARRLGARVYGHSPVTALERAAGGYRLRTPRGALHAEQIMFCTNAYTPELAGALRRTVVPVCSVQVATRPLPAELRAGVLPQRQVVSDMYRLLVYYRYDAAGRLLMGGRGAYGDAGIARQMRRLRERAAQLFGERLGRLEWEYAWGGYVGMTQDHFPHWHRLGPGAYAALGYNGRGVAMSTQMGRLLAEAATGAADDDLDYPCTPVRPIPLHALHKLMVGTAVAWNGLLDRADRR